MTSASKKPTTSAILSIIRLETILMRGGQGESEGSKLDQLKHSDFKNKV